MASAHKVLVILSSVRDGRHGGKVGLAVLKHLESILGLTAEILGNAITNQLPFILWYLIRPLFFLDPAEIDAPLLKQPIHFMPNQDGAPEWMKETKAKIAEASGFVIVSSEYNCTIPPALTNLLDYFPPAVYRHKPASIVTYSMGTNQFFTSFEKSLSVSRATSEDLLQQ